MSYSEFPACTNATQNCHNHGDCINDNNNNNNNNNITNNTFHCDGNYYFDPYTDCNLNFYQIWDGKEIYCSLVHIILIIILILIQKLYNPSLRRYISNNNNKSYTNNTS